ncbi:hypothetical protein CXG81DRAFT_27805 [Caulochytrium protostelioides]|uniref:AAA+ ATPase domain-containing protein n=1 Tax=Caulochytrium protostelioides TaxID=1555241 RepID=A0A4P9X356_9FUNG|nr:hypothetical protein CXG81DRAFT_27805 [Caulochytrium protostelioides]|eukprot:RKO99434.1 hypothetical protein CXG81DRAFT_27805 [Caulochytrium protostelioides]
MSGATYNRMADEAASQLSAHLTKELPVAQLMKRDAETTQRLLVLYLHYLQILRHLAVVCDQLAHPQKRRVVKDLTRAVIARVLELRQQLNDNHQTDFLQIGDALLKLDVTPDVLDVAIPTWYLEELEPSLASRQHEVQRLGCPPFAQNERRPLYDGMSRAEAVALLQKAERARQARVRARYMHDIKREGQKQHEASENEESSHIHHAVVAIQRVYRGHAARRRYRQLRLDDLVFFGLEALPPLPGQASAVAAKHATETYRREQRRLNETEYQDALVSIREKIAHIEGQDMRETIQDGFRQWYLEYKRLHGKFPSMPAMEEFVQIGYTPRLDKTDGDAAAAVATAAAAAAAKEKKDPKKEAAAAAAAKKDAAKKGDAKKNDVPERVIPDESRWLKDVEALAKTYVETYVDKPDDGNLAQKHDAEIIKAQKRIEVEKEIRAETYTLLEQELMNLKISIDKEKVPKAKKAKKKSAKKGKKNKDLTANQTMESLVQELAEAGILQQPSYATRLTDFHGDYHLAKPLNDAKTAFIEPSLYQVRQRMAEAYALPLGLAVDETTPEIPFRPSLLLGGAPGTGKTTLVEMLANETGALVFNLSPAVTAGQFAGKVLTTKMVHMAFKVAKAHPPSIIYIDDAEMVFAKRVPKENKTDPKRIKRDLVKQLKTLKPSDRVLVVGATRRPWDGDSKAVTAAFQTHIYCPLPSYTARYELWKQFIAEALGGPAKPHDIDLSFLARISEHMSAGTIKKMVARVLSERRQRLLELRPVTTTEFIELLLRAETVPADVRQKWADWCLKWPVTQQRGIALGLIDDPALAKDKGKAAGAKGKAK